MAESEKKDFAKSRLQKYDWEELYKEFVDSALSLREFLEEKGINSTSPHVKAKTHWWRKSLTETQKYLATLGSRLWGGDKHAQIENIWELLMQWREKSAMTHYRWAHAAGVHVELMLQKAAEIDADGNPVATKLDPKELNALVAAMERIQKIQRIALGLSADNPGVVPPQKPDEGHIEKQDTEQDGPVFVVTVNERGKFSTPRPRIVSPISNGSPEFIPKKEG